MPLSPRRRVQLALAAWTACALAFARHRIPYDDEWFSLTLARDTTWTAFWRSLARDIHPPYVALLDRATIALVHDFSAISVVHVAASSAAVALLASSASRLGVRAWAVPIGALHPIVLMYGGAARWYPFAFLADALRLWALTRWAGERPEGRGDRLAPYAFAAGCALGVMSGYAECVLVFLDAVAMIVASTNRRRAWSLAAMSAIIPAASLVLWPPFFAHLAASSAAGDLSAGARGIVMFYGLGALGEAHPSPPWTALALLALPGLFVAVTATRVRPLVKALARSALGWSLTAPLGVWHPRYALLLWAGLGALVVDAVAEAYFQRSARPLTWAPAASLAYLALGATLTARERSFFKGDLNRLPGEACEPIYAEAPDAVIAPYPRLASALDATCRAPVRATTAGWIRHYEPDDDALFSAISASLESAHRIAFVTVPTGGSSLEETQIRARALVAARCRPVGKRDAVEDDFASLKPWTRPHGAQKSYRLRVERFVCP